MPLSCSNSQDYCAQKKIKMANERHLAVLKEGTADWNAWRLESPPNCPDLRKALLHQMNLEGANLKCADLREANLFCANLAGANLAGANLVAADLRQS